MRILITGASGSGTTTLGKAFSEHFGWNFFDADDYYWVPTEPPYKEKRDHDQRVDMIVKDLCICDNAVVSGSIMNWGSEFEDSFDLIVFLYLEMAIRVERVRQREKKRFRSVDPKFIKWLSEYDTGPSEGRSLAKHNEWLLKRNCKIVRIEGNLSTEDRVKVIAEVLS